MKLIKSMAIMLLLTIFFISCEKDDICDSGTPTTSRLVIKFYNFNTQTKVKAVTNLRINAEGLTPLVVNTSSDLTQKYLLNDTIVKIPLKIDFNQTKYTFVLNANSTTANVTDAIEINYNRQNEYISRACGFRTFFNLNGTNLSPLIINNNSGSTSGNWIKDYQITKSIINNENETHIKIFI